MYPATTPNAMISGRSRTHRVPGRAADPITVSTDSMPTSCGAMYGMVARIPVTATASPRPCEPYRARTNSPGLTKPCARATDHSRGAKTKMTGNTMMV